MPTKNRRLSLWEAVLLVVAVLVFVQQLVFPYLFAPICWLPPEEYAETIHVISVDGPDHLLPTNNHFMNIYYCARFGATDQLLTLPNTIQLLTLPNTIPPLGN